MSASRVGAALGHSPYATPQEVAYELIHGVPLHAVNDYQQAAMDRGTREEPMIRDTFRRVMDGKAVVLDGMGVFLRGGMEGQYIATPDGFLVRDGQIYCVEYKRCSRYQVEPDSAYLLQVWMQCHVTGAAGGYLFCVTPDEGWALWTLRMDRMASLSADLLAALQYFTQCKERIAGEKVRQTGRAARKEALVGALTSCGALSPAARWRGHVYDGADGTIFFSR